MWRYMPWGLVGLILRVFFTGLGDLNGWIAVFDVFRCLRVRSWGFWVYGG